MNPVLLERIPSDWESWNWNGSKSHNLTVLQEIPCIGEDVGPDPYLCEIWADSLQSRQGKALLWDRRSVGTALSPAVSVRALIILGSRHDTAASLHHSWPPVTVCCVTHTHSWPPEPKQSHQERDSPPTPTLTQTSTIQPDPALAPSVSSCPGLVFTKHFCSPLRVSPSRTESFLPKAFS